MAEYDELGQQLDALIQEQSLLKAPGVFREKQNPGSIEAYRLQREALSQRIADLRRRYEASLGNPGAVTGTTLAGMNAPLVPALKSVAPTLTNAPVNPAELADPTAGITPMRSGALPPPRKPGPRVVRPPVGAFAGIQDSDLAMDAPATGQPASVATAAPAAAQAQAAAPAAPQKGLREQYMERLAAMTRQQDPKLTEQQKGQALMEAGLAIMAAASKPGSSAMGAIGQGGMQGTAVAREMDRINRERADKQRSEDRANLGTEFTLAGHDIDRADRRTEKAEDRTVRREEIARQEARDSATDTRESRRIDLLQKQIEQGKVQVIENGQTGTFTILNTTTGETRDTGVKVKAKDDTPAEVKLLQALRRDPKLLETYKEIKGEKGGVSERDILSQAVEFAKPQVGIGGTESPETVLQRSVDSVRRVTGRQSTGGNAQAEAIREQFRQGKITKDQAVKELQKLGFK